MMLRLRPLAEKLSMTPEIASIPESWRKHKFGYVAEKFSANNMEIWVEPQAHEPGITPQNANIADEILALTPKYIREGHYNGTLFTLNASQNAEVIGEQSLKEWMPPRARYGVSMGGLKTWAGRKLSTSIVSLAVGKCSYFEHMAWMKGDIEGMKPPNALLVSGIVATSDGYLVFGTRESEYSQGKVGVIGGTYNAEPVEKGRSFADPLDVMLDELVTEISIHPQDILTIFPSAIMYDRLPGTTNGLADEKTRPVLTYKVGLDIDRSELHERFTPDDEHSALLFVKNNHRAILDFMRKYPPKLMHPPADLILGSLLN